MSFILKRGAPWALLRCAPDGARASFGHTSSDREANMTTLLEVLARVALRLRDDVWARALLKLDLRSRRRGCMPHGDPVAEARVMVP